MKARRKRLTKAERELLERRRIGARLAVCAFNLSTGGYELDRRTRDVLRMLYQRWDAIENAKRVKDPDHG